MGGDVGGGFGQLTTQSNEHLIVQCSMPGAMQEFSVKSILDCASSHGYENE